MTWICPFMQVLMYTYASLVSCETSLA